MSSTIIIGSGSYVPERVIGRKDFMDVEFYTEAGERIDKANAEIIDKFIEITEIEERRYTQDDEFNSDIALKAAKEAIDDAGIDPETLDYIIFASNFGEVRNNGMADFMPTMAARLKNKLGIKNILRILSNIFNFPSKSIGFFTLRFFLFLTVFKSHPIICVSPLAHLCCLDTSVKKSDGASSINSTSET